MNEELDSRLEKISFEATKQSASARYIDNLITSDHVKLVEVFSNQDGNTFSESELFDKVEQTIKTMQMEALRTSGITVSYLNVDDERRFAEPTVRLGWRQYKLAIPSIYVTDPNEVYPHILRLTDVGINIVDGWRKTQGYVSLDEQWNINQDREEARRNRTYDN